MTIILDLKVLPDILIIIITDLKPRKDKANTLLDHCLIIQISISSITHIDEIITEAASCILLQHKNILNA